MQSIPINTGLNLFLQISLILAFLQLSVISLAVSFIIIYLGTLYIMTPIIILFLQQFRMLQRDCLLQEVRTRIVLQDHYEIFCLEKLSSLHNLIYLIRCKRELKKGNKKSNIRSLSLNVVEFRFLAGILSFQRFIS